MSLLDGVNSYITQTTSVASTSTTTTASTDASVPAVQGIPVDTVAIASKSLFAGIGTSNVALNVNMKNNLPNTFDAIVIDRNVSSVLSNTRNIALAGGIISLASNVYNYVQSDITGSRIVGNVSADMVGALGGGIIASSVGGVIGSTIRSATCSSLGGLVFGTLAFAGTEILYKKTGLYTAITDKVTSLIDSLLNRQNSSGGW